MSDTAPVVPKAEESARVRSARGRRIMTLVLVVLILLLGLSSYLLFSLTVVPKRSGKPGAQVSTGGLTWIRSIYGTSNKREDLFGQTVAAAPDPAGDIWVTDAKTKALMRFTPDGRYLGSVRSQEASWPFQTPSRLTVGPDGLIYVCETALNLVRVLNPDGTDAGSFGIPQPVSVAASRDRLAVGSVYGFAILEKSGKPIKVVGSRGKGDGQFDYVHGIAMDAKDNVYVTDSYNNRVAAYDRNGKRLWMVPTGSPANTASYDGGMLTPRVTTATPLAAGDQLQLPLGLTVDGAGRVVVIDMYDCSIAVFDPKNGKLIGKYGEGGSDDGQFFYPVSISYDAGHDWFTVADAFNKRIEIVRIPGSSGGIGMMAAARRTLAGPLRACLFPLLLLLIAIVTAAVAWFRRRRRGAQAAPVTGDAAA